MRFGTWNVRSPYRAASLETEASELTTPNLDLVAVEEVTWDNCGSQPIADFTFCHGNGNDNHHSGTGFSYITESYQLLRG
jgi:hypothetical protein